MRIFVISIAISLLATLNANTIEKKSLAQEIPSLEDEFGQIWKPAPTAPGGLNWATLINVDVKKKSVGDPYYDIPIFNTELEGLDKTTVKLNGYMVPLEATEMQGHFVLMAYPHSCPFDVPAGPGGYVEVVADFPVKYTYEPVVIEGEFQLLENFEHGVFYRISAAREVK